ncbi:hypothetical protein WICPIJ_000280 [Wickerhamomyces pijperi]|uniref:Uncharacterized protein n=1 Tax=Wickerhamomyces pijperi TaxID=599730 RepID=A0A9P8TS09_WICPI|nr:hypothetical protein WICPIJ_000280 [Wickerhamomyces pijperi]
MFTSRHEEALEEVHQLGESSYRHYTESQASMARDSFGLEGQTYHNPTASSSTHQKQIGQDPNDIEMDELENTARQSTESETSLLFETLSIYTQRTSFCQTEGTMLPPEMKTHSQPQTVDDSYQIMNSIKLQNDQSGEQDQQIRHDNIVRNGTTVDSTMWSLSNTKMWRQLQRFVSPIESWVNDYWVLLFAFGCVVFLIWIVLKYKGAKG